MPELWAGSGAGAGAALAPSGAMKPLALHRKHVLGLLAGLLLFGLAFAMLSDAAPAEVKTEAHMPHAKTLVLYYSRTGTTAKLGDEIAKATGADVERLRDTVDRAGAWGFVRSIVDAARKKGTTLQPLRVDPAQYELVILGTPDWGRSISAPMRSFLAAYQGKLNRVAFFLTDGTSDHAAIFREMAELSGREPVATLGVPHDEVVKGAYTEALKKFLASLNAEQPQPAAPVPAPAAM